MKIISNLSYMYYILFTISIIYITMYSYVGASYFSWVVLSFDDWPNEWTLLIGDLLKKKSLTWEFYFVGKKAIKHPEIVYKIHEMGHIVWNHTYSHKNLASVWYKEALFEILYGKKILEDIIWQKVNKFRPPYGSIDKKTRYYISKYWLDLEWSLDVWVLDSMDWYYMDSNKIKKRINGSKWYSKIVFHDSEWTYKFLCDILNVK